MELRQLRYFIAVQQYRSFTKAANALHISQPTVTAAIRNLEAELNTVLIDRTTCMLTPSGEALMLRAERVFINLDTVVAAIRSGAYQQHKLCIAVPPVSCASLYGPILDEFSPLHPDIDIRIDDRCNAELLEHLKQYGSDIDAGFIIRPDTLPDEISYLDLSGGSVYVLLSDRHPLAEKDAVRFEDLSGERILMYEKGTSYTEARITKEFSRRGIPLHISQYFTNISTITDVVSQNYGISFILETTSPTLTHIPHVVMRPFAESVDYRIGLIWNRTTHLSDPCRAFIRFIKERYGLPGSPALSAPLRE